MSDEEWWRGWSLLVREAERVGWYEGAATSYRCVPWDLWQRMLAYPPKPHPICPQSGEHQ